MTALPRSYDAWKQATPRDDDADPGDVTVTYPVSIECSAGTLECEGTYDGYGDLLSVWIDGRDVPVETLAAVFGRSSWQAAAKLSEAQVEELIAEQAQDRAGERADYLRDVRMDR